jgi:hypothetical protein
MAVSRGAWRTGSDCQGKRRTLSRLPPGGLAGETLPGPIARHGNPPRRRRGDRPALSALPYTPWLHTETTWADGRWCSELSVESHAVPGVRAGADWAARQDTGPHASGDSDLDGRDGSHGVGGQHVAMPAGRPTSFCNWLVTRTLQECADRGRPREERVSLGCRLTCGISCGRRSSPEFRSQPPHTPRMILSRPAGTIDMPCHPTVDICDTAFAGYGVSDRYSMILAAVAVKVAPLLKRVETRAWQHGRLRRLEGRQHPRRQTWLFAEGKRVGTRGGHEADSREEQVQGG